MELAHVNVQVALGSTVLWSFFFSSLISNPPGALELRHFHLNKHALDTQFAFSGVDVQILSQSAAVLLARRSVCGS